VRLTPTPARRRLSASRSPPPSRGRGNEGDLSRGLASLRLLRSPVEVFVVEGAEEAQEVVEVFVVDAKAGGVAVDRFERDRAGAAEADQAAWAEVFEGLQVERQAGRELGPAFGQRRQRPSLLRCRLGEPGRGAAGGQAMAEDGP
jgi:hypothetical protein